MCGITGAVWTADGEPVSLETLVRMTRVMAHRGPDGQGEHWDQQSDGSGVALGHRRLSIIDLAGGTQPMSNEDGTVWVTFNGEIYNYRELRPALEAAGHQFRTNSDTETIVHLYEEKGIDFLQDLRGMFGLAIWDGPRRRLVVARDRLGQKPIVYRHVPGQFLFASEIKSILQVPSVPRELDPVALDEYLAYLYVPHPRTMFRGIRKLEPGSYAVYENGELRVDRYWSPDLNKCTSLSPAEMREALEAELMEAVRLRLRSDVPLGAFLSGGIDSTVIVGLMQRHASQPTKTYTIGFQADDYDESADAREIAAHLKTDHHELFVEPDSLGILPTLVYHYDEPFADSSAIPTYYVSQATREHVKVALTGDGGDELFGGYERYQTVDKFSKFDRLPPLARALLGNRLWDWMPTANRQDSVLRRIRRRMMLLREPSDRRFANFVTMFDRARRQATYSDAFRAELGDADAEGVFAAAMANCARRGGGSRAMLTDVQTRLPCDMLAKVDIASMAHGLECRSPFLDHRVVELAIGIPFAQKVVGTDTKHIVKETFSELIPPRIARRHKMGFCVPIDEWFRDGQHDFLLDHLLDPLSLDRGYFSPAAVRTLISEHQSGAWDHSHRLWTLLCLELWHRTFVDPAVAPTEPDHSLLPVAAPAVC